MLTAGGVRLGLRDGGGGAGDGDLCGGLGQGARQHAGLETAPGQDVPGDIAFIFIALHYSHLLTLARITIVCYFLCGLYANGQCST